MRIKTLLILIAFVLAACVQAQEPATEPATPPPDTAVTQPPVEFPSQVPVLNPYAPQPNDSNLMPGAVFLEEMGLLIRESYPPQISLEMSGSLPTPCHQLRVQVEEPDENNRIDAEAYSVVNPDMLCTQVLAPFQASIDMGTFPSGHYSVWVNGELAGEFDS